MLPDAKDISENTGKIRSETLVPRLDALVKAYEEISPIQLLVRICSFNVGIRRRPSPLFLAEDCLNTSRRPYFLKREDLPHTRP
jgi:tryptophan synthase beta subunit